MKRVFITFLIAGVSCGTAFTQSTPSAPNQPTTPQTPTVQPGVPSGVPLQPGIRPGVQQRRGVQQPGAVQVPGGPAQPAAPVQPGVQPGLQLPGVQQPGVPPGTIVPPNPGTIVPPNPGTIVPANPGTIVPPTPGTIVPPNNGVPGAVPGGAGRLTPGVPIVPGTIAPGTGGTGGIQPGTGSLGGTIAPPGSAAPQVVQPPTQPVVPPTGVVNPATGGVINNPVPGQPVNPNVVPGQQFPGRSTIPQRRIDGRFQNNRGNFRGADSGSDENRPTELTRAQRQAINRLALEFHQLASANQISPVQQRRFEQIFRVAALGTVRPPDSAINQFVADLLNSWPDQGFSVQQRNQLAIDVVRLLNSEILTPEEVQLVINDAQAVFLASGMSPQQIQNLVNQMGTIAQSLQPAVGGQTELQDIETREGPSSGTDQNVTEPDLNPNENLK